MAATRRHAEIAGAGFAGLVAAATLANQGWSVRVHEANDELRETGAGLFLWGNGLSVLESLGVYEALAAGAHAAPHWDVRVGDTLKRREPTNTADSVRMLTMTRQHLYATVLAAAQAAGAEIVTSSPVAGATPDGTLTLRDGRTLRADLVVGADGVRSAVRDAMPFQVGRRRYQDGIIRVLTGRQGHVGGEWDHVIDFWPAGERALRVLYAPCDGDTLYLAMMASLDDAAAIRLPVDVPLWSAHFPQLAPFLRTLEARGRFDGYEATHLDRWSIGRVVLVGDAANAMPPTLGQGAGCAMMNAYTMALAVSGADAVEQALPAWEQRERPLTDHTQSRSEQVAALRRSRVDLGLDDMAMDVARHVPTGAGVHGGKAPA